MSRTYDEMVKVFQKSGELVGTARFSGRARKSPRGGLWSWRGWLYNANFDAGDIWEAKEARLEFEDGAFGDVIITNVEVGSHSSRIEMIGNGTPPRIEAS